MPDNTPSVAAIPLGFDYHAPAVSRQRLRGSIVRTTDGDYFMVPTAEAAHGPQSKKLDLSASGRAEEAKDFTENGLGNLNVEAVLIGVLLDEDPDGVSGTGLLVQGIPVTVKPIYDANGFKSVLVHIAGGSPVARDIDDLTTIVPSLSWLP